MILAAALWRVASAFEPALANVSPITALALSGALASSLVFYLVTNTAAWAADAYYPGTVAGWWMALTIGHPEFPPTLWFFRNTLAGDLLFTGLFVGAMAFAAARERTTEPQPS